MESSESNQLEAVPVMCRAGCGFFGSHNTEEFCSKCYKDQQKKKQQSSNSSSTPATPPPTLASSRTSTPPPSHSPAKDLAEVVATSLAQDQTREQLPEASSSSTQDDLDDSSSDKELGKKKKNKCASCKKKVGLTGFTCRCGGLYCGVHRYSDKHECSFDYRQLGAQEIRANNPVIKGEKIQKI